MKMKPTKKEYNRSDLTITWEPHKCIHSEKCWRNLPEVFRYKQKPWINPEGASKEAIIRQIDRCPSGALGYIDPEASDDQESTSNQLDMINIVKDGPILIQGEVEITTSGGKTVEKNPALCRCGSSANKPFCDGSHNKIGFKE